MLLTKKSFRKILIMVICYFAFGSICMAVSIFFAGIGITDYFLPILGAITYLLGIVMAVWGGYAEGKGRWINLGNRLVRNELKPAEFIRHYEQLRDATDLVVKKPSVEVLLLASVAYDSLDDREKALLTANEMIAVASEKKKPFAKLAKASLLFSYGNVEKAESLFQEAQTQKLDVMCRGLADAILKSDRAYAFGDYKTVETYHLNILEQTFPALDLLGRLVTHYKLGEVYEKLQDNEKAVSYYQYCVAHGGETAIRLSAMERMRHLK